MDKEKGKAKYFGGGRNCIWAVLVMGRRSLASRVERDGGGVAAAAGGVDGRIAGQFRQLPPQLTKSCPSLKSDKFQFRQHPLQPNSTPSPARHPQPCYAVIIMPIIPTPPPNSTPSPARDPKPFYAVTIMPIIPTPPPNSTPSPARDLKPCYAVFIMPIIPTPTPNSTPSPARDLKPCYSVFIMPIIPTPQPNSTPSTARDPQPCYAVFIMPIIPTPTPNFAPSPARDPKPCYAANILQFQPPISAQFTPNPAAAHPVQKKIIGRHCATSAHSRRHQSTYRVNLNGLRSHRT